MTLYGITIPPTPRKIWNKLAYMSANHFAALGKAGRVYQCDADKHIVTVIGKEERSGHD